MPPLTVNRGFPPFWTARTVQNMDSNLPVLVFLLPEDEVCSFLKFICLVTHSKIINPNLICDVIKHFDLMPGLNILKTPSRDLEDMLPVRTYILLGPAIIGKRAKSRNITTPRQEFWPRCVKLR